MKVSKYLLALIVMLLLVGCEDEEQAKIFAAQECLDKATDLASANACADMVSGLTSADSFIIRCSADFIGEGFTANKIADVFQAANTAQGDNQDPLVGLMSVLTFKTLVAATAAKDTCAQTNSEGMAMFGIIAEIATTFGSLAGCLPTCSVAQLATGIGNGTKDAELGVLVNTLDITYCANPDNAGTDICTEVIGTANPGNPSSAGTNFRTGLDTTN
ncbi:MAG: hypothetical protein HN353_00520 [Bdellovibrionales bacterium]|nr:hypothetical protein [Bdellovibrionales bacterium]MBT3525658.1 hypothetical protein [Bdellovibrionales bacterium]MBT7670262.1 hypothetical protein [Bdellovibrionales bacterium]MBT7766065.1 hypothetical protein [Bdellovibrionales bacterium]